MVAFFWRWCAPRDAWCVMVLVPDFSRVFAPFYHIPVLHEIRSRIFSLAQIILATLPLAEECSLPINQINRVTTGVHRSHPGKGKWYVLEVMHVLFNDDVCFIFQALCSPRRFAFQMLRAIYIASHTICHLEFSSSSMTTMKGHIFRNHSYKVVAFLYA